MLRILSLFLILFSANIIVSQTIRVAILDFDNISGIPKYDGLGKAMSSMLISDIEANVSPKRLQLVERAQVQKILKEQNFQASGSVNKNTAVQTGKILGVNYLLVGDVYILNDQLIINARLTNTETGDIVFAKKQEGKTVAWLTLKTIIAKDLATSLSQPFIEPTIPDKEIPVATITTFGNAVAAKDTGNIQMAETLSSTVIDFSPDFKYIEDLRKEIDELKKQVKLNTEDIEILKSSGDLVLNAKKLEEYENNLKSVLLSKEKKFDVFVNMIKNHADVLISKPLPYGDYGYEINFANQLDYNSLDFIDGQLNVLEKLNSENQKILLIKLIRGEILTILWKYNQFFVHKIPASNINETKLVATINLFKKCLNKYQELCYSDISSREIYFLELFVPFKMIQNGYIEADFIGVDTIFFKSPEFKSLQKNLLEDFVTNLTDSYKVDNQITQSLVSYYNQNGINYWYWNLLLFIYFNEINKSTNKLDKVIAINDYVKILKNFVGEEDNLKSYNNLSIPLIIDKTGVRYNDNLNKLEVKIGNQIWMTKNLNVDQFQNGDKISQAKTFEEWNNFLQQGEAAWCYYNFNENNTQECGKIYNWFAVIDKRLLAPKGWHIPSSSEWNTFASQIGGCFSKKLDSLYSCASKLKKQGVWDDNYFHNSTNESGFSALPCGRLHKELKGEYSFEEAHNEKKSFWWSSTWIEPTSSGYQHHNFAENKQLIEKYYYDMVYSIISDNDMSSSETTVLENTFAISSSKITLGLFVRCLKDVSERKFINDGDSVIMRGHSELNGVRIGFGQIVNIPDANFKAYLVGNAFININKDTEIQVTEASYFNRTIDCSQQNISDLTGIEAFTALIGMRCGENQLTILDVSKNTALTYLDCRQNQLTSLKVSGASALTSLDCRYNQLTSLDVSKNTALVYLACSSNQLTSLDVSQNTALIQLWCHHNQLRSLDISKNTALTKYFECDGNKFNCDALKRKYGID